MRFTVLVPCATDKEGGVVITAPTGCAALLIGGQTLHAFAGCGVPKNVEAMRNIWGPKTRGNWTTLRTLVIDEIGMLSAEFLDWLDVTVRELHLCGDVLQLGPIPGSISLAENPMPDRSPGKSGFGQPIGLRIEGSLHAFQTACFREVNNRPWKP
ncbi:hypothetical protein T484DRAFT_1765252 [Baffinella frigidus]|nr:hypothetical protein T484DRAFT_1765252 [Cryptophyta sp. CCMP2293]